VGYVNNNNTCYNFNVDSYVQYYADYTQGTGQVSCLIELTKLDSMAQVFVHDPEIAGKDWSSMFSVLDTLPSGLCTATLNNGTHTQLWWKKNVFQYSKQTLVGYDRMDFNQFQDKSFDPSKYTAFLNIYVGDYYEWTYQEKHWNTGFDFWFFMGMVGGAFFFCLLLHGFAFYPLKCLIEARDRETQKLTQRIQEIEPENETKYGAL